MKIPEFIKNNALLGVFALSLAGIVGSLYYSEIRHIPPCNLCWYQRIAIYPIALISAVAIWRNDKYAYTYILPLAFAGLAVSIYHNLLYYGILPEIIRPCTVGIPCTQQTVQLFGFITIPLMALATLIMIIVLSFIYRHKSLTETASEQINVKNG